MIPRPATPGSEIDGAGGAYVRRRFTFGERVLANGDRLTAEEIAVIPRANLHSLINLNLIELYPVPPEMAELRAALTERTTEVEGLKTELETLKAELAERTAEVEVLTAAPPPSVTGGCFLMPDETGKKFHVVQGRQVTEQPLSRAQAMARMKELA